MNKLKKWFKNITPTDWVAISILIVAIAGMFVLPYLVTQKSWKYHLEFEKPNEIGDTLGGILGPFIGLISAFLVYLALREQIKANINIQDQFKKEETNTSENFMLNEAFKMLKDIEKSLMNIEVEEKKASSNENSDISRICEIIIGSKMYHLGNDLSKDLVKSQLRYVCEPIQLVLGNIQDIQKLAIFYIRYRTFLDSWFPARWETYTDLTRPGVFDYNNCKDVDFFGNYVSVHQFRRTLFKRITSLDEPKFQNLNIISNPDWSILEKLEKEYLDLAK